MKIPGFSRISRRDRSISENRSGIATFCKHDIANVVFVKHSDEAERSWHFILRDSGTLALCNWYRPPHTENMSIESLKTELDAFAPQVVGALIAGDLNVHHVRWLRLSSGNSVQGGMLWELCQENGLVQLVRGPTRNNYLLDLI